MRDRPLTPSMALSVLLLALLISGFQAPLHGQWNPDLFRSMEARLIGPAGMSGRVTAVDVDPSEKNRIFVGAASGGVWRSENGGVTWRPVFDDQPVQTIGDVVVSPANPDLIWVGTGEGNPRQSVSTGRGVFRSLDGGDTWTHVGLENSERISRVIAHPTNPDIAYVGAMGPLWADGEERGLYKTSDRGKTWQRILYVDPRTGVADMRMDPQNPDKLFVAMYEHRRSPWLYEGGGEGSGLYVTRDGGETWTKLGPEHGLPAGRLGRIGLAVSRSSPDVVYALVEAERNALIRSDDGGRNWRTINDTTGINPRPMYFADIRVDPKNENRVYRLAGTTDMSEDAGRTWRAVVPSNIIHGDVHELWIDPDNPRRLIMGNDGGIGISYDMGRTWRFVENLPLAQFYQLSVDMAVPFNVYGGVQDSGNYYGPSSVWDARGIINAHWRRVGGGDGFATMADRSNPRFAYATSQHGNVSRFDKVTMERRNIRPPTPPGDTLRWNWNTAMATDAHDPTVFYFGSQYVHRTRDGGRTWEIISPDLTTDDPGKQHPTPTGRPVSTEGDVNNSILAIETSPLEPGVIWATTDDGKIQLTRDNGATWKDVGIRLPSDAPDSAYVPEVKASRHVAGRAYVAVDNHRRGDMRSYVYVTQDYGERWERLPTGADIAFAHEIEEDPVEQNLLFLGTEHGMHMSFDRGQSWMKWTHGLPSAPIREVIVHPRDHDLVIATHGRAIWIVDDMRPLREVAADPSIRNRPLHVFTPPPAQQHEVAMEGDAGIHLGYRVVGHAMFFGESRPYGAILSYWVGSGASADTAQVEIRDAEGQIVRRLEGPTQNGVNRLVWDLRAEVTAQQAEGLGGGGPGGGGGGAQQRRGAEVAPGRYQVTIRIGGQESTTTVDVVPDPRKEGVEFFIGP